MKFPSRPILISVALLGALALAPGCGTSARPYAMTAELDRTEREVFGDIAAHEFSKHLQVRLPAKLAVADVTSYDDDLDHRRLVQAVNGLAEDTSTYNDVVSLEPQPGIAAEDLRSLAASHQADLQISVFRRETVRGESNGWSFLKLLIVPMLFVPTEENDVQLTVRAMVRDVRNGLVYTTFDDHAETRISSSVVSEDGDVRRTSDELFEACVARMRETLARKLATLERSSD